MIWHLIFDEYLRPRLELPTAWPTPRMLRRQEQVLFARKREALQLRQHFEVKMVDLAQAPVDVLKVNHELAGGFKHDFYFP